jgi:hypothetical protein
MCLEYLIKYSFENSGKKGSKGKVLDLDKNVINGYYTFNTVAIDDGKQLHLVDTYRSSSVTIYKKECWSVGTRTID